MEGEGEGEHSPRAGDKVERTVNGRMGQGSPGVQEGAEQASWMGPRHREWSHVTESQGQSLAVSWRHCEPSSGEHFGLTSTQHVLTQPVCRSWDCPRPTQEGPERCRPSRKVTKLERGRLGFQTRTVGLQSPSSYPGITQPLPDCQPGE